MATKSRKETSNLGIRVALLENMIVQQNEAISQRLTGIERVLTEVHNKQDTYILGTSVKMEGLQGQINLQVERTAAVSTKVNKFFAGLLTIFAAILGGVFSMPELFGLKK